jgi:hypothetical protein
MIGYSNLAEGDKNGKTQIPRGESDSDRFQMNLVVILRFEHYQFCQLFRLARLLEITTDRATIRSVSGDMLPTNIAAGSTQIERLAISDTRFRAHLHDL